MMMECIWAALVSFAVTAVLGPFVIPALVRLKMGNTEREELESHQKKAGTPSMGGVMFLAGVLVASLVFANRYPNIVPVLILTLGFGAIGFIDDYLKAVKKQSDGLIAWQKIILQFLVTAVFAWYVIKKLQISLTLLIPFTGKELYIGPFAVILMFFAVLGTVNGTNFTDGVDGLASTVTLVVAIFFTLASVERGGSIEPITLAMCGGLMGFLLYNAHPAKVFMGDTGSLALGGFVAASAYMLQMPLFILIVGLIYVVEVLSVIIQVTYFKKTGGKRIFKMAPIHHHFELSGWSETKVVAVFSIVTAILSFVALLAI